MALALQSLARYHPCNRLRISLSSQSKSQFTALNHSPWPFLFVQATAAQMAGSISTGAGCGGGSISRREEEREPRDFQYGWDFQVTDMAALIEYTPASLVASAAAATVLQRCLVPSPLCRRHPMRGPCAG